MNALTIAAVKDMIVKYGADAVVDFLNNRANPADVMDLAMALSVKMDGREIVNALS